MDIILFYIPFPSEDEACDSIRLLLEEKLIACGNVINAQSAYHWLGNVASENEWIAIIKTTPEMTVHLENRIKDIHPYEIPAIIHWTVSCNESYATWVRQQVMPY